MLLRSFSLMGLRAHADFMLWRIGYDLDTSTACRRCGSSVSTDPMFGAHVTRKPWPQH